MSFGKIKDFLWPVIGLLAVIFSGWLLYKEFSGLSAGAVLESLKAIPAHRWGLAVLSTLVAYGALAWYDRIALMHLGHHLGWGFISAVSFSTYALSHNIGASMFSGAVVRYRAYSTKGLTAGEVGVLVALCSFTFTLGSVLMGGMVLIFEPELILNLFDVPLVMARGVGFLMIASVGLYFIASLLHLRPLHIGSLQIFYPRPAIVVRQLLAAPLELMGAAGIIYFALPEQAGVSFFAVAGAFVASFSAALLSHAPGGLGVLEYVFYKVMPSIALADVVAALLVFRLLYLIIPLIFAIVMVVLFERNKLVETFTKRHP